MKIKDLKALHKIHKEETLFGRYIYNAHIEPLLEKLKSTFQIDTIGQSVHGQNIFALTIGSGKKKVLMWSQMHGNESTTTKALFDLFNFLGSENTSAKAILNSCTFKIIPILCPDGAKAYTRLNANNIDLNRDAQDLSQPESKVLRSCFNDFKPDFCFNLHGQRTIFSAGNTSNVATVSFLAPAQDKLCTITNNRKQAMSIIVRMNAMLQKEIPNNVGIYDDNFNINCVGDTFQAFNVPTVLFEAGHGANDYNREEVRRLMFQSFIVALENISDNNLDVEDYKEYLKIPENKKLFFDVIIRDAKVGDEILDVAIQYQERIIDNSLQFIPKVEEIGKLSKFYAHRTIHASSNEVFTKKLTPVYVGYENDFVLINNEKLSLKILKP